MDSDKILVMSAGRALEYESPETLISNPESAYYSMAKDAGLVEKKNENQGNDSSAL